MPVMSAKALSIAIRNIRGTREKLQEQVHEALVSAAYYALSRDNNTTPLNQVLDAVGNAAYVRGITLWVELNLPVIVRGGKFTMTKAGKEVALQNEDEFAEWEMQLRGVPKWYEIAGKQKVESVFDCPAYLARVYKHLEKEGQKDVADVIRKAVAAANFAEVLVDADSE